MATTTQFTDPTYMEAVYAALLSQLKTATFGGGIKLVTAERVIEPPQQIASANQPALVLINGPVRVEQKEFALGKWTFTAVAAVYLWAEEDQATLAASQANYVVWGLQAALLSTDRGQYEKQTLGGLVYHCWVEGDVLTEVQAQQVVITVPIMILAGPNG